jgi:DNA-binding transcriptional MerR regulator
MTDDDKLLTIQEAAAFLRTPVATLRFWRSQGIGPPSFKIGRRIYYWLYEILAWLDEQRGQTGKDDHRRGHPVSTKA